MNEVTYPCNLSNLSNSNIDNNIKELFYNLRKYYKGVYDIPDLTKLSSYNLAKRLGYHNNNIWLLTPNYRRYLQNKRINIKNINKNNIINIDNDLVDTYKKYENINIHHSGSQDYHYNMQYNIYYEDSMVLFHIYNNFKYPLFYIFSENIHFFCQNNKNIDTIPIFKTYNYNQICIPENYKNDEYILIELKDYNLHSDIFDVINNKQIIYMYSDILEYNIKEFAIKNNINIIKFEDNIELFIKNLILKLNI